MNKVVLALVVNLVVGVATAQASGGRFVNIGGNQAQLPTCINHNDGSQVPIITNQKISNPAFSTLDQQTGRPEIFIDAQALARLGVETSQDTLTFIVEHECGHVNLGHLSLGAESARQTNQHELDADCYAAHAVKTMGFTQDDMKKVILDVDKLPKDPSHPAGLVRAANIVKCYAGNR